MWGRDRDLNPGARLHRANQIMAEFKEFCSVDLHLSKRTIEGHLRQIKRFLRVIGDKDIVTREDIRRFLSQFSYAEPSTYANIIKSLRIFFRDYLGKPELIATFKFPNRGFNPKVIPSKEDLKRFYEALKDNRERALFMLYATSGLRRDEILNLHKDYIDFSQRMIKPQKDSRTKHSWVTFYNSECEQVLMAYLKGRRDNNPKLIPIGSRDYRAMWRRGDGNAIKISPQALRDWFAEEMSRLNMAERYIDAFCGRVPRSILARHYTDYSPEKLKAIYDKAAIKVLR